ncbi:uncharacterized protein Pyn_10368 [Prunus yedoensis var. nudiflora]|uniref:Polymerase nucleotidyl transferase domain-containing protein n=1 Tax=Prunus yedoensis var. nudiflora TaxID=2094558 RepID=A0A314Z1S1_PRUYE|nr:uncharacterized protein Pyn_10368 [Prunus yedoensis var. nudiflora]
MGEHEGWAQPPSGLLPNGLLPNEAASVMRVLDSERWLKAEERTAELIACIQPNPPSEERRNAVADYVQRLIMKCFPCQVFTFGSVPLKTYLPDGDIDLTAFSKTQNLKDTWAHQVRDMLENEEKNENAEFRVKEVQYIQAEVKIIKCLVENIVVDISFNQLGGLCTLCFLEEVDHLINQNHLFKRSIILIKAWCYYESRILGAHHGLISTYALETLVLYIFHVFNNSFAGPLEVLYRFLEFFSKFDWDNFCVSLWGPVPISALPDVTAEPPRKDGGELLLSKLFLDACSSVYAVFPGGQENQGQRLFPNILMLLILCESITTWDVVLVKVTSSEYAVHLHLGLKGWPDHLHGSENLRNISSDQKNESSSGRVTHGDGTHGSLSVPSQHGSYPLESTSGNSDVPTGTHAQSQKNHGNTNTARASDQIRKETNSNLGAKVDKGQRSARPDNLVNDLHGRFLFARTRSSPELTDSYGEVSSQGRRNRAPESGKSQTYSTRHISSHQSLDATVDSNSYHDESGLSAIADDYASISGTQGMHQEEQDLVNMMASSTAHGFNGPVHLPLNLASSHLPLPIPPSILASMGYAQRNMGGMVPTNFPMIETPWGTNMQFPQGVVPSPLAPYFPGLGLSSNPEDSVEPSNENFGSVEMNSGETDHDFWHQQERGSTGGFDLENGSFELLQEDDKQQSTSAGYNFHPSSRVGTSGSSMRVQQKPKENRDALREDHVDNFQYQDNKGNEVYFDDRTVSSRSATYTSSVRSKTSSESSWEGSSAKVSKSTREKRGRRTALSAAPSAAFGKGKSVSEHSSTQADDDNRDWNQPTTLGAEMVERSTGPQPVASLHVPRHQMPGFEPSQTSGSDSLIPFAPVLLGPGSRQRASNDSGMLFYPTGPPVPFVTMLPYNYFSTESGTSDVSANQFSREGGPDNSDSGQNFDSSEGADQPERFCKSLAEFAIWTFCQNSRHPSPSVYPSPVMVPPVYLQGRFPWDGPGRPLSANMNLFTQLVGYGPRLVPVAPLQSVSNRPASVYQRYVEEIPRYRSGTGTYLPNPKVTVRDRHPSSTRRGNYNYERNDHHGDREGNWNTNSKSRASGATTVATKVRSQIQEQTVWQLVRAELKGHGAHIGRTHSLHINLKMVLSAQTLRRVVPQMLHMACIRYQP